MSTRSKVTELNGLYYLIFTCTKWLNLIEITNGYDLIYNWFAILKKNGSYICGYVIMLNHVHAIIPFKNTHNKSINSIVGNAKRFIAFDIIERLKQLQKFELLEELVGMVSH